MRLDEVAAVAVRPEALAAGSPVQVCTRMGAVVAEGAVAYPVAAGACVGERFYRADLYLFVPHARAVEEAKAKDAADKDKKKAGLGKLDPEALPDDVRLAVTVDHDLDEEAVQRVLAAVGDAAKDALKNVGMREDELYARVAAILERVREVLVVAEGSSEDAAAAKGRVDRASKAKRKQAQKDDEA
jgi:hypothetical protein